LQKYNELSGNNRKTLNYGKQEKNETPRRSKTETATRSKTMKVDWFEALVEVVCILFLIAMSPFHISYDGYLGLTKTQWETIWAISINGFTLIILILVANLTAGQLSLFFKVVLIPYFCVKLVYDFSVFSGVYIISPQWWEDVWSSILPVLVVIYLIRWLYLNKLNYAH